MIEEAPGLKEVSHFHFRQLCGLKVAKGNDKAPAKAVNVVAAASKYGMLFVGIENGFKILKLENILDLDEDKKVKTLEENYYSKTVTFGTPVLLSLSADQKTLAVCVSNNSCAVAHMYDIAAFADPEESPKPFLDVQLSNSPAELREFMWNPAVDGMYAYCLSDGSLHVHELSGTVLKIVASVTNASATTVCWSPKGKQLVVGKNEGSFTQYKPTLQEVKTIPAPKLDENSLSVTSICWISTTVFAVLYVPTTGDLYPNLVIVSTPKGSPVVYTNFYDVCLGNGSNFDQRYFLHYESSWELLICASTDSIEVAVLGDPPNWVQWDLKEDGKALLLGKNGASRSIGMGVMYCAQRRIVIDEHESYPPMPVIFFLTDNGLLVPFHMINSSPDCASLVRPSTPIERDNERKRPETSEIPKLQNQNDILPPKPADTSFKSLANTMPTLSPVESATVTVNNNNNNAVNVPSFKIWPNPPKSSEPGLIYNAESLFVPTSEVQQPVLPAASLSHSSLVSNPTSVSGTFFGTLPSASPLSESSVPETSMWHNFFKDAPLNVTAPPPPPPPIRERESFGRPVAVPVRAIPMSKLAPECDQANMKMASNLQPAPPPPSVPLVEAHVERQPEAQDTYMTAIIEEITNFEKELQELKQSSDSVNIGTKEEMANLKNFTLNFEEFQNDMAETMQSLNSDIHSLKNMLLESFVMVEDAHSRERRKNDHSYISILKDRALDPLTAKRLQKINQHYNYLSTQLLEVNNKLDQDWVEFLEAKKQNKQAIQHISSSEAIYRAIVNNQVTIHNLQKTVEQLSHKVAQKKLDNISKRKRAQYYRSSGPEELAELADAFLLTKISSTEEAPEIRKKIPLEVSEVLKKHLSTSAVPTVRPSVLYSPSQSRLLSTTSLIKKEKSPKVKDMQDINANITSYGATTPPLPPNENLESERGYHTTSDSIFAKEVITQLTKPKPQDNLQPSNAFIPKFTIPEGAVIPGMTIPSPVTHPPSDSLYEDITPPDSPVASSVLYEHSTPRVANSTAGEVAFSQKAATQSSPPQLLNMKSPESQLQVFPNDASTVFASANVQKSGNPPVKFVLPQRPPVLNSATKSTVESSRSKENVVFHSTPSSFGQSVISGHFSPPASASGTSKLESSSDAASSLPSKSTLPTFSFSHSLPASKNATFSFSQSNTISPTAKPSNSVPDVVSVPTSEVVQTSKEELQTLPKFSFFSSGFGNSSENSKASSTTAAATSLFFGTGNKPSSTFPSLAFTANETSKESSEKTKPEILVLNQSAPNSVSDSKALEQTVSSTSASSKSDTIKSTTPAFIQLAPSTSTEVQLTSSFVINPSTQTVTFPSAFGQPSTAQENKSEAITTTSAASTSTDLSSVRPVLTSSAPSSFGSLTFPNATAGSLVFAPTTTTDSLFKTPISQTGSLTFGKKASSVESTTTSSLQPFSPPPNIVVPPPPPPPPVSTSVLAATTSSVTVPESPSSNSQSAFQSPTAIAVTTTTITIATTTTPIAQSSGTTVQPVFGLISTAGNSFFAPTSTSSIAAVTTTTATPVFGQAPNQTPSFFGQPSTTQPSFFNKPSSETSVFGQGAVTQNSSFGSPSAAGAFGQGASTFFSQPPGGQPSVFGSPDANSSGFVNQSSASTFSFGKSPFGQASGSFGLSKSVFAQNTGTFQQQPTTTASSVFGQSSGGSIFGQGTFFSGLGEKPNPENAAKNVFGSVNIDKSSTESNLFGSAGATSFGIKPGSFTGGSFSSGGGSVAQSGFGAFQQTPQKPAGGFGSPPAFGSNPSFGGAPTFGSPPAFGSGSPLAGSVFGGSQQSANFSSFASASSPTFGSLASQSPTFGNQGFNQQSSPFGGTGGSVFGSSPSFGGQSSGFGSPSSGTGNTSAFTQWRN